MKSLRRGALLPALLAGMLFVLTSAGPANATDTSNLLDMSIEDLLGMEVTSASRKKQSLAQTPSALFVITRDDIRRTGVRSVPEALRLAPGLQVAQIDANKWAISARGFNGRFANKLLVLMDGRTLYSPSFSGVFWDVQDTVLEDIERIEVIRGPGGTLWGSNAVNGVINIITRDARDTQGSVVAATYGERRARSAVARYGGTAGEGLGYRAYVKYQDAPGNEDLAGRDTADDWHQLRVGARADWSLGGAQTASVAAEAYDGRSGESLNLATLTPPYLSRLDSSQEVSGGFVRGRWESVWAPGTETSVQLYVDTTSRDTTIYGEDRDTVDIELQHRLPLGVRHDVVAGLAYRYDRFDFRLTEQIMVTSESPRSSRFSAFIQDEIALVPDRLALTLGAKVEHNELSDKNVDVLPNVRLSWTVSDSHNLWAAVTSAIRTPSYADLSVTLTGLGSSSVVPPGTAQNPFPLPIQVQITGNPAIKSEELVAYEVGYRGRLGDRLSLDASLFVNQYDDLRSTAPVGLFCDSTGEPVDPLAPPACLLTSTSLLNRVTFSNSGRLRTQGLELAVDWRALESLRVTGTYTWLHLTEQSDSSLLDQPLADQSPEHAFSVRGELAVREDLDLDVWVRYVDALDAGDIDSYWSADVRLAWRPIDALELSVTGTNLVGEDRLEWISELGDIVPTAIQRSISASVRWSF